MGDRYRFDLRVHVEVEASSYDEALAACYGLERRMSDRLKVWLNGRPRSDGSRRREILGVDTIGLPEKQGERR